MNTFKPVTSIFIGLFLHQKARGSQEMKQTEHMRCPVSQLVPV